LKNFDSFFYDRSTFYTLGYYIFFLTFIRRIITLVVLKYIHNIS